MATTKQRIERERSEKSANAGDAEDLPFTIVSEAERGHQPVPDPHYGDLLKKDF